MSSSLSSRGFMQKFQSISHKESHNDKFPETYPLPQTAPHYQYPARRFVDRIEVCHKYERAT